MDYKLRLHLCIVESSDHTFNPISRLESGCRFRTLYRSTSSDHTIIVNIVVKQCQNKSRKSNSAKVSTELWSDQNKKYYHTKESAGK